jgi:hypothetical protein
MPQISYAELVARAPSVCSLLEARGAVKDDFFKDYQAFLEDAQTYTETECVHSNEVPMRGNLHIPLGLVAKKKDTEATLARDENWKVPKAKD